MVNPALPFIDNEYYILQEQPYYDYDKDFLALHNIDPADITLYLTGEVRIRGTKTHYRWYMDTCEQICFEEDIYDGNNRK